MRIEISNLARFTLLVFCMRSPCDSVEASIQRQAVSSTLLDEEWKWPERVIDRAGLGGKDDAYWEQKTSHIVFGHEHIATLKVVIGQAIKTGQYSGETVSHFTRFLDAAKAEQDAKETSTTEI